MKPLSIVIFSKDRAAQLDLCLNSIYKNLSSVSDSFKIDVVYTASSKDFEKGYDKLKNYWDYSFLYFHDEAIYGGFRETLESVMNECGEYVLFFTDDDIVYREINHRYEDIKIGSEIFCLSLRLGCNTFVQDQYRNTNCVIPDDVILGDDLIRTWDWKTQQKDTNFAYPFSVDGHMFKSEWAKTIIKNTKGYHNPNSLEGKAQHVVKDMLDTLPDKMACFETSNVINTPVNRVQETCTNKAGIFFTEPAEELNSQFISGSRLSLEDMDFSTIIGVHQEIKLKWMV